jgi:hypothetical protein
MRECWSDQYSIHIPTNSITNSILYFINIILQFDYLPLIHDGNDDYVFEVDLEYK